MWPAALGPRNPNYAVQKVNVVPPQVEEAAAAQACVHGEDDLFGQQWRRLDCLRRLNEAAVLLLSEIAQPGVVFVEKLDATHGIGRREVARHAPVEERLQNREVLVDSAVSHLLGALQFHVLNVGGRD